jgi:hypothetical protein
MSDATQVPKPASQQPAATPAQPSQAPSQPAITSANLPGTVKEVIIDVADGQITAKPLVDADFTRLKPKNSLMALYFGNRIANNGLRIEDLKARGFRLATPDEVTTWDGKAISEGLIKNGHVQRGDLLLLIMPKADYVGQLNYNRASADARVSRAANKERMRDELGTALREVGGLPQRYKGKIQIYNPNASEVENS